MIFFFNIRDMNHCRGQTNLLHIKKRTLSRLSHAIRKAENIYVSYGKQSVRSFKSLTRTHWTLSMSFQSLYFLTIYTTVYVVLRRYGVFLANTIWMANPLEIINFNNALNSPHFWHYSTILCCGVIELASPF